MFVIGDSHIVATLGYNYMQWFHFIHIWAFDGSGQCFPWIPDTIVRQLFA